ncbi:hypothetical protein KIPB_016934, partial [Kipferlia bialata]|eukprot:g16934.t1
MAYTDMAQEAGLERTMGDIVCTFSALPVCSLPLGLSSSGTCMEECMLTLSEAE